MNSKSESGRNLIALRPRITRPCPDCGVEFTAYKEALSCKKCANKRRQKKFKLKNKKVNEMANLTAKNSHKQNTVARSIHCPHAEKFTTYSVEFNTKTKEAIFVKYFRNDNKQEVVGRANCKSRNVANAIFEKWEANNFEKLEI